MSLTHLFLFLLLFFILNTNSFAQNSKLNDIAQINEAYHNILKLKLSIGREQLKKLPTQLTKSPHYFYVKNIADIFELITTQDATLYKKYLKHEDENLKGLKPLGDDNPFKLFYESEIKLHWALIKTLFGDEISAGLSLRSAHSAIYKNRKKFPEFTPNYKTQAMFHILLSTMPESSLWLLNLFGMKGNLQLGLSELNKISPNSAYHLEVQYFKALVLINIQNKKKESLDLLGLLLKSNVDNLILNYLMSTTLIKFGESEQALSKLSKLQYHSKNYLFLNTINYKLGEIHLQKQDYHIARNYYALFLNNYQGKDLIKDAWFKVFLTYWLSGDKNMSDVHFTKAKNSGRTFSSADKNANGILNQDSYPNAKLMQLRLATDGGYFLIAQGIANNITENSFESKKDKTEYYYRIGRLLHKTEKYDEAIFHYLNTIKKSGSEHWYFAPNACLQTGYIYQNNNELEKAKFYFEKAIKYKKHKYKSSIDREAKAALESIKHY